MATLTVAAPPVAPGIVVLAVTEATVPEDGLTLMGIDHLAS